MKLQKLNIEEIVKNIKAGKHFEAQSVSGGFKIKISKYAPYCCLAVHAGANLRVSLHKKIALNDYERWYEEDPFTDDFIKSLPVTLIANDSRFEYDLNREPENCVYKKEWGKDVWNTPLSSNEKKTSRQKHFEFYTVLFALVSKLEKMFGGCIVFDIHSYNYKRWDRETPLFNIGTERLDAEKYCKTINKWKDELSKIIIPEVENIVGENDVFYGRGYALNFITENFKKTLVLATEIKKVYCDELSGDPYPKVIRQLQQKLKQAIINTTNEYCVDLPEWHHVSAMKLLDKNLNTNILSIDNAIYKIMRKYEVLAVVNPINADSERNKFFNSRYSRLPVFKYNPIKISSYSIKQELMKIPVQEIEDISIRNMYVELVTSSFNKIDLISSLNTDSFLYNSLKYFGQPDENDLRNAKYLLLLPDIQGEAKRQPLYDAKAAMKMLKSTLEEYGFNAKLELSNKTVSKIVVLNSRKSILIKDDAVFKRKELDALAEHEVGVHMLTTVNSNLQKLKIFNLGLPVNTMTQEGLAILAEYLSGNLTLERLKKIALRVIAVDAMCNGADFVEAFNLLKKEYGVDPRLAYSIVTRIFRGGGYTKDYLYLRGFVKILRMWEEYHDISPLLIGKTSIKYFDLITEMIERDMVQNPKYLTKSFLSSQNEKNSLYYPYILGGLQ